MAILQVIKRSYSGTARLVKFCAMTINNYIKDGFQTSDWQEQNFINYYGLTPSSRQKSGTMLSINMDPHQLPKSMGFREAVSK